MHVPSPDRKRFIWPRFSYHLFQAKIDYCYDSSEEDTEDDEDDEDDDNVSSTELRDIIEDTNVQLGKTTTLRNEIEQFQAAERAICEQVN